MLLRLLPPTWKNVPPAYTVEPFTARQLTDAPLTWGFQGVTEPSVILRAARLLRSTPPKLVKYPPAYTTEPLAESAKTVLLGFGSQEDTVPEAALIAASELRVVPLMVVNAPPT